MDSKLTQELQQRLNELQLIFQQQLPGRLDELRQCWQQLMESWNSEELGRLHRICHSLAGSGGSFGAYQLGQAARALEQRLKAQLAEGERPDANTMRQLQQLLDELCKCATSWSPSGSQRP